MISDQDLLFLTKHQIEYYCVLNVMYNNIDIEKVRLKCEETKWDVNCVTLYISNHDKLYKVRVFKNHLIILNTKYDINFINKILQFCGIDAYTMINIDHIRAETNFKNKIKKEMFPTINSVQNKTALRLEFKMGQCYVYADKCLFSCNKIEDIINMYKIIYSKVDLPMIVKCIFNYKHSLFFLLPLELADIILSFL